MNKSPPVSPLVSGPELWTALGFRKSNAFSQAARHGRLPIAVFTLPGRAGKFALRDDLDRWVAALPGRAQKDAMVGDGAQAP